MNAISHTLFLRDLYRFQNQYVAEQSLSRSSAVTQIWFGCLAFPFSGNFPWDLSGHTSIYTQLRFSVLQVGSIYLPGVFNVRCWLCLNVASYSLISLGNIYFLLNDCDLHTIYVLNHSLDGLIPVPRQLIEWTGPTHVLDKKSGERERCPSARQAIGNWACQPNCPRHSTERTFKSHHFLSITT